MRKIAVVNFKGGTGKTTTVVNVGAGLALRGQRVLLVDADPQGGVALSLGLSYVYSLTDAIAGAAAIQQCVTNARERLDVIPAGAALLPVQLHRALSRYVDYTKVLGDILRPLEGSYDWALLDCATSITLLTVNALACADEVFVPTRVEFLSLAGLNQVLENLARIRFPGQPRQAATDLGVSLIIPTMYDARDRQAGRLLAELRRIYGRHVTHPIRANMRLSEAPAHHRTIYEHAPASAGAADYSRLVGIVLQETSLAEEQPIGLNMVFPLAHEELPAALVQEETPTPRGTPAPEDVSTSMEVPPADTQPAPAEDSTPAPEAPPAGPQLPAPPATPAPALSSCPYCGSHLVSLNVAGYRVYQCDRCGYQKQVLLRDLHRR